MTVATIATFAASYGYRELCFTDHLWSALVKGASDWYRPQDIAHVLQSKPLPVIPGLSSFLGCEAEYLGGDKLSLTRAEFDLFDFVTIPVNHMHMRAFVRPEGVFDTRDMAVLVLSRLRSLLRLDLPWGKIGIAHLSCPTTFDEGSTADVLAAMDRSALTDVFQALAQKGAGIELNARAFVEWNNRKDAYLAFYAAAAEAGCRFYTASDAHDVDSLCGVQAVLPEVIEALGLAEFQKYHIQHDN